MHACSYEQSAIGKVREYESHKDHHVRVHIPKLIQEWPDAPDSVAESKALYVEVLMQKDSCELLLFLVSRVSRR